MPGVYRGLDTAEFLREIRDNRVPAHDRRVDLKHPTGGLRVRETRKGVIGGGAKCTSDRKVAKLRDEHLGRLIDLLGCRKQLNIQYLQDFQKIE